MGKDAVRLRASSTGARRLDAGLSARPARRGLVLAMSLALGGALDLVLNSTAMAENFPAVLPLSGLDGTNGFKIDGESNLLRAGRSVSRAGDINGDGIDDLIIGSDGFVGEYSGRSYVVFGSRDPFPVNLQLSSLDGWVGFKIAGAVSGERAGSSVSSAGDINGDGIDDLIIGAPAAESNGINSGRSYVVFGSRSGFPGTLELSSLDGSNGFRLDGEAVGNRSGRSVSAAGDINGDGIGDLIIGTTGGLLPGSESTISYVVFGTREGFPANLSLSSLDGTNGFRVLGESVLALSGTAVSAAGDVNGDGIDDLIVGTSGAGVGFSYIGRSYVVYGSRDGFDPGIKLSGLNGTRGFKILGDQPFGRAGATVSAGDINGDGIHDLIIGAPRASPVPNGINSGSSFVVFGSRNGFPTPFQLTSLDGEQSFRLDGEGPYHLAGSALSAVGDINGDGIQDLIIGAHGARPNDILSGRSYVVFGSRGSYPGTLQLSSLTGIRGFKLDGETQRDVSGFSASAAGDINGDGIDDLIIGAPEADSNGPLTGRSYVVFGRITGVPELDFSDTVLDFGQVLVGDSSLILSIMVRNQSPARVDVTAIQSPVAPFLAGDHSCGPVPFRLATGSACRLEFQFRPANHGSFQQVVGVSSSAQTGRTSIFLRGTGVLGDLMFHNGFE